MIERASVRVFAVPQAWAAGQRVRLSPEESHYLLRVRRGRIGWEVELLDGEGAAWLAVLVATEERTAVLELQRSRPAVVVMPLVLVLVVPEPRATLEALTLASELAATEVVLVEGDHSPSGVPSAERIARTLRAAQRQCGRVSPPRVGPAPSLAAALERTQAWPGYVASVPDRHTPTPVQVDPLGGARLLVGPEGGLSASEQEAALEAGLRPLALGPWVLRTPTAVAAGLARLQAAFGPDHGPGHGPEHDPA